MAATMYKLRIPSRLDASFTVVNAHTLKDIPTPEGFNPVNHKMFNQDIFTYIEGKVEILHSSTRCMKVIPGVLALEKSQTYGRVKDKFLYKCIPDDKRIPIFLVPYKLRLGFNKSIKNKYVVFEFKEWTGKHPRGVLRQTIGDVDTLENFYEYQLYCKSLYASIQNITKKAMKALKKTTEDELTEMMIQNSQPKLIDDRHKEIIYTIDPTHSKDFDDAFSIKQCEGGHIIHIYISNVPFWMETLDLWDSFSNRISSIYLPDRKRPMLPTVMSDALCSLTQGDTRFALRLALTVNSDFKITSHSFDNCIIKVEKNLRYGTKAQETNVYYKKLFGVIKKMNRKHKYVDSINDSHDVIAYLMIIYNYLSAQRFINEGVGIFRSAQFKDTFVPPEDMPQGVRKFLKNWNSTGGKYSKDIGSHDMLELDAYVHITSPIRRLVDMLNMMTMLDICGWKMSEKAQVFYAKWTSDSSIEYINTTMRSIRKVQNDCSLLKFCMDDPTVQQKIYEGYIFDKLVRNDALYQYMVYLPEINMVNRFTSRYDKQNLSKQTFKIYVFTDQNSLKRKIRVEVQQ
jgi:exoribonuclease R